MLRSIISVVVGYLSIAIVTMLSTGLLASAFGLPLKPADPSFRPPTPYVAANLCAGFVCAMLGGVVAARLAPRSPQAHALVLAGAALAFGVLFGIMNRTGPHPGWYLVLLPIVACVGVAIGGRLGAGSAQTRGEASAV